MNDPIWSLYILRCADDSLYTGIATDVARRFSEHQAEGPKAAKYTRGKGPLKLVYQKVVGTRSQASKEELRIKGLSRKEKLALVGSCEEELNR